MRYIQALLMAVCFSVVAHAQYLALDSAGNGGFENGTSFGANGWTAVPVTPPNYWVTSATLPYHGARCAFISNDGTNNTYNNAAARTSHIYYDVTVPTGSVNVRLKFYFRGSGQAGVDRMFVSTAPTSVIPVVNVPAAPGTAITGATNVWTQTTFATAWTPVAISLPGTLAGSTFRLIFTWTNDNSGGTSPPAAVDNISVEYNCGTPAPIGGGFETCIGSSTLLTNDSAGGTWSSSGLSVGTISSTGNFTGLAQGTAIVTYTTGCAAPSTRVVTVNAYPSPIAGPSDVCVGSTITMTDTAWGGSWGTIGSLISVNSAGVVTGISPGIDTVKYVGCGITEKKAITVRPLPPAITGLTDTLCEAGSIDDTLQLSNAMPGGTWSTLDPSIAVVNPSTGLVTGVTDGIATIRYTSSYTCVTDKTVTVKQLPDPITGVTPICLGGLDAVFASAWPGGVWSSTLTGVATVTSGVVHGLAAGTTVISYANGCGAVTAIATVDPHPSAIIGPDSMCVGNTVTFASPTIGGSWSSTVPGVATVLSSSGVITGVTSGLSVISYIMPSGGGCNTSKAIKVVDLPPAITGSMDACPGQTADLANSEPGGTWTSLSPATASISSSGKVTGLIAGTSVIKYTTPAGCVVYTLFTVNPVPEAIVGENEYCAGAKDTLSDPTPDGTWSAVGSAASIGSTSGILDVSAAATGTVTGTVKYTVTSTGCSVTKSFIVNPLPVPPIAYDGYTGVMSTDTGYVTYQWYHSVKGKLPGAVTNKIAATFTGSYTVEVTDKKGCVGISAPKSFTWTGVAETGGAAPVHIFPNPATDDIYVDAPFETRIAVSSLDGKILVDQAKTQSVNISHIPAGVYMVSVFNSEGARILIEKLVKQ